MENCVPCFGLTEPNAGSDATSITSNGVIFKDENDELKIRLNFEKKIYNFRKCSNFDWSCFCFKRPEHLLGDKEDLGITFAVFDSKLEGIDNSKDMTHLEFLL